MTQPVLPYAVLNDLLPVFIKRAVEGCSLPDIHRNLTNTTGMKKTFIVRSLHLKQWYSLLE